MLLSDDVLRAIGRVAVLAGRLELDQCMLTGALIGPDPEVRDVMAKPADSFARLQDIARRLIVSRYAGHEFRAEHGLKMALETWMRAANESMERRNAIIHGPCGIGATGEPSYLTTRKPHAGQTMTADELDELADRIDALSQRSRQLIADVTAAVQTRTQFVMSMVDGESGDTSAS